ncbi:hypothetical protein [Actinokineospora xionganensis]|uniref:Uncharacterized protein n=1 Tax=Actinokineospora xionganensis TaxID=2684470 RepID=A0ABR7L6H3_9PSEU|nr:hypothetical protein [Actinokineospora xionganensis]MBC6448239.1 hypothetical protein [Actinokineospora xionganensis]
MPAYNTVTAERPAVCPVCGLEQLRDVQFTFGETWQLAYRVGDRIKWGANDSGEPGHPRVGVAGYGEDCVRCGAVDPVERYDIVIADDVIASVTPADGSVRYGPDDWTVLA